MYLRALVGPEEICYLFLDNPALIHRMMQAWLELADAVAARVQQAVEIDEVFLAEDIAYNHGLLISPAMVREFLFPYYTRLLASVRSRQRHKKLYLHVDTDGNCDEAIDLYREIGLGVMSPFEVAAGNDAVAVARKYPDLVILGGIDKRVLAEGPAAIDRHLEHILPVMVRRGGFIPTCDHGVPDNVSYASYMHYRRRVMAMDH
jgi:uroporphyrinogen decarboxylase